MGCGFIMRSTHCSPSRLPGGPSRALSCACGIGMVTPDEYRTGIKRAAGAAKERMAQSRSQDKKITAYAAIFEVRIGFTPSNESCFGLDHRADALGAQNLAHLAPILQNRDGLQVGAESSRCSLFGPRAVQAKGRLFTTVCTLCHLTIPFYFDPSQPGRMVSSNNLSA